MNRIVILGAGVMGSALAVPAAEHPDNHITLVGSPLDNHIIEALQQSCEHPTLNVTLPPGIDCIMESELSNTVLQQADVVVIGVSSPGVPWVISKLQMADARPALLALITKGLVSSPQSLAAPITYADAIPPDMSTPANGVIGIAGPCIARELAFKVPTRVTFASRTNANAERLKEIFQTDYYRIAISDDIVTVEACAALKNFLCIGVSAMLGQYTVGDTHAKNPVAGLFTQAVVELASLSRWLKLCSIGDPAPAVGNCQKGASVYAGLTDAFDLAGMGDLHVTVGGGRNSRLGGYLGKGKLLSSILDGPMCEVTVEGVDTGRQLSAGFRAACESGELQASHFPLSRAILECIDNDAAFQFDFSSLPG